jgi:hypothetical protein
MNIIRIEYRFLRLYANLLALVELHPSSNIPQATTCLYPVSPYLSDLRKDLVRFWQGEDELQDWLVDCQFSFELAVAEAKRHPIIDYRNKFGRDKEVCLWSYLNPLEEIGWDEYCPLFDNNYNYVLRD